MKLLAEKNGHRRYFTEKQWDVLGTDKYGWVLVPAEVAHDVTTAKLSTEPPIAIIGSVSQAQAPLQTPKPKRRKK
jgi:hypothetical protein